MKFSKANIKSPYFVLSILLFYLATGFFLYLGLANKVPFLIVFLGMLLCFITLLVCVEIGTKIYFTDSKIIVRSFGFSKELYWENIKTVGVYATSRYEYKILDRHEYHKFLVGKQKYIYISEKENCAPLRYRKEPYGYIEFHYRSPIYRELEKRIQQRANTLTQK
jgi:hypothetical protein